MWGGTAVLTRGGFLEIADHHSVPILSLLLVNLFLFTARGSCEAGWSYFDQFCYFFDETRRTFEDSEQACSDLGGHLVSIHSAEEESFLSCEMSHSLTPLY